MAKITNEIKALAEKTEIFAIGTASKAGEPNVAAIRFAKIISNDELFIVDNFMLKTRRNIAENPRVSATFWAEGRGYQLKGTATVFESGERFEEGVNWVKGLGLALNPKAVIILKVEEVYQGTGGPNAGKRLD